MDTRSSATRPIRPALGRVSDVSLDGRAAGSGPRVAAQVFIFRFGDFVGTEMFDPSTPIEIGRARDADLVLDESTVSRRHCRLTLVDGDLFVEDQESANGTLVNALRIDGRSTLEPRDALQVGPFTLKVRVLTPREWRRAGGGGEMTRVEAVLDGEGSKTDLVDVEDAGEAVDRRLYEDAVRRRTGSESPDAPPAVALGAARDTSVDLVVESGLVVGAGGEAASDPRAATPMPPEDGARLRDLDALIASLDRRALDHRGERAPGNVIDLARRRSSAGSPRNQSGPDPERAPGEDEDTLEVHDGLPTPAQSREAGRSREAAGHPALSDLRPLPRGGASNVEVSVPEMTDDPGSDVQNGSAFSGIEISARLGPRVMDVAFLRGPGEQYVLGHPTPQGSRAPAHAHVGLRLLRINADSTVDLVFPRDARGHLVRGSLTVMFSELTEGRKYSCLRLEASDRATVILGHPGRAVAYHVRFLQAGESASTRGMSQKGLRLPPVT